MKCASKSIIKSNEEELKVLKILELRFKNESYNGELFCTPFHYFEHFLSHILHLNFIYIVYN